MEIRDYKKQTKKKLSLKDKFLCIKYKILCELYNLIDKKIEKLGTYLGTCKNGCEKCKYYKCNWRTEVLKEYE